MKISSIEIFIPIKLTDRITVTKIEEILGMDETYDNGPWRGLHVGFNGNSYALGLFYFKYERDDKQNFHIDDGEKYINRYSKHEKTAKKHVRELISQLEKFYFKNVAFH